MREASSRSNEQIALLAEASTRSNELLETLCEVLKASQAPGRAVETPVTGSPGPMSILRTPDVSKVRFSDESGQVSLPGADEGYGSRKVLARDTSSGSDGSDCAVTTPVTGRYPVLSDSQVTTVRDSPEKSDVLCRCCAVVRVVAHPSDRSDADVR